MTRIIGGTARGRRLKTPTGAATRPTTDRVREALFSALESWTGSLSGLRFLDLYAGSGAVGLEAMSRGAGIATLVEQSRATAKLIGTNAATLGFHRADVLAQPVARALATPPRAPYDLVFVDPPYPLADDEVSQTLADLAGNDWLAVDALVVVERAARSVEPAWPSGLKSLRSKQYGETMLWYGHARPSGTAATVGES